MECVVLRSFVKHRNIYAKASLFKNTYLNARNAIAGCVHMNDVRLYHRDRIHPTSRFPSIKLLSSSALCASHPFTLQPQQTRTLIISKVVELFREADLTSLAGVSKFILESTPVTFVGNFYQYTEALTGQPWGLNIFLCSFTIQLLLNVPANIYMGKWMTGKEKHTADMLAIRSSVLRAPNRENFAMFNEMNKELAQTYGCQNYKLYASIAYQILHVTITSFAVRSLVLNPDLGLQNEFLPWGACLNSIDPYFLLPIGTFAMSLLLVEVAAWKKLYSEDGLKMTLRRASATFKPQPLYLLNLKRAMSLPFLLIYSVVPSALTIHWFAMMVTSVNVQILLTHKRTRRALGIPTCYYETDKPYHDFLKYLRHDYTLFSQKISKKKIIN